MTTYLSQAIFCGLDFRPQIHVEHLSQIFLPWPLYLLIYLTLLLTRSFFPSVHLTSSHFSAPFNRFNFSPSILSLTLDPYGTHPFSLSMSFSLRSLRSACHRILLGLVLCPVQPPYIAVYKIKLPPEDEGQFSLYGEQEVTVCVPISNIYILHVRLYLLLEKRETRVLKHFMLKSYHYFSSLFLCNTVLP